MVAAIFVGVSHLAFRETMAWFDFCERLSQGPIFKAL